MQAAHSLEEVAIPTPDFRPDYRADWSFGQMAGRSPAMQRLFQQMRHTARHLRVATIEGESGTGKMLAARTLHEFGPDSESPFVPWPASRFFEAHHAMSPALTRSTPRWDFSLVPTVKQSCRGTLVLTRLDELSAAHQGRLLELLQWIDHQHILGALDSIPQRILFLSGQPLRKLVLTGALRSDLLSRLTAIRFALPPLRERSDDVPLLADLFAQRFSETHGKPLRGLGPQTLPHLYRHSWPGNVRELKSVIHSAALACPGQWIRPIDLPALTALPVPEESALEPPASDRAENQDPNLDRAILRHIQYVLTRVEGNKLRAAKMLGISRSTLYRLLENANAH